MITKAIMHYQVLFAPDAAEGAGKTPAITVVTDKGLYDFSTSVTESAAAAEGVTVESKEAGGTRNGFRNVAPVPALVRSLSINEVDKEEGLANWCRLPGDRFLSSRGNVIKLFAAKGDAVSCVSEHSCVDAVHWIRRDPGGLVAAAQLSNGIVLEVKVTDDGVMSVRPWRDNVRTKKPYLSVAVSAAAAGGGTNRLLGLTAGHRLQVDGTEVCPDVSSFALHSDFLLVTELRHRLRCLPLGSLGKVGKEGFVVEVGKIWFIEFVQ